MTQTCRRIEAVAGVLGDAHARVLLAQRCQPQAYAGQWEFPGGKIEPGETAYAALTRELAEELGVTVRAARPLISLQHRYPEFEVQLSVWRIERYDGVPGARESQPLAWVAPGELPQWPLLAADRPVIAALLLPPHYVFTPWSAPLEELIAALPRLPRGALLRVRRPPTSATVDAARLVAAAVGTGLGPVLGDPIAATQPGGMHLRAAELARAGRRPLPPAPDCWFGASVHSRAELEQAVRIDADFAVLGPVAASPSHPGRPGLGWPRWARIREGFALPVYAIGGVGPRDLQTAWKNGAQGVAGISAYWSAGGSSPESESPSSGTE
ncbi:MAG: Nudix family hydrolase [Gammaproteobacteria bacterium]|nr:Nudix family hydrolase [Gammaproteobacteria bacterium]